MHAPKMSLHWHELLALAEQGDYVAQDIVWRASHELMLAVRAVQHQLDMEDLPLAFFGGLLSAPNALSLLLCKMLGLQPSASETFSALVGAAICALDIMGKRPQSSAH